MPNDEYNAANLNPQLLRKVRQLETELRSATNEKIVLVAYQEHDDDDSDYVFPYWE
jgi:hypothetical protein